MIPTREKGIRRFCLWALGMAVLTLNKIHRHRDFNDGNQVKITRRTVKATISITSFFASNNWMLAQLFKMAARNLPETDISDDLFFKK